MVIPSTKMREDEKEGKKNRIEENEIVKSKLMKYTHIRVRIYNIHRYTPIHRCVSIDIYITVENAISNGELSMILRMTNRIVSIN